MTWSESPQDHPIRPVGLVLVVLDGLVSLEPVEVVEQQYLGLLDDLAEILDDDLRDDLLLNVIGGASTTRSSSSCSSLPRQTSCGSRSGLRGYLSWVGCATSGDH